MGQYGTGQYDAQGNEIQKQWYDVFTPTTGFSMNPDDYAAAFRNINPYSQQAANSLFGGNVNNFIAQGLGGVGGGFNEFMNNQAPALANLTQNTVGNQMNQAMEQGRRNSELALRGVLDQGSNNNALYSSFTGSRANQAVNDANLNAALQASGMYNNFLGNLYNTQLPLAQQQAMQQAQLAQGLLGMQTQFGDQMFVQPDMSTQASAFNQAMGYLSPFISSGLGAGNIAAGAGLL